MKRENLAAVFFATAMLLGLAVSAGAVDGVIEINQAKVLANGGFPYTIGASGSGSYRLTGNLTAPAGKDAIDVNASHVTIDLNGFTIFGPGASSVAIYGIQSPSGFVGLTVENGTVTAFSAGVITGPYAIVRNVHADLNGAGIIGTDNSVIEGCTANGNTTSSGISCGGSGCSISHNTANGNKSGIACNSGCEISGNTASNNNGTGISCVGVGCLITNNSIDNNSDVGIYAIDSSTAYGWNVLNGDTGITNGTSMAGKNTNSCGGAAC
jgi:parallel beta-helix repeat protein